MSPGRPCQDVSDVFFRGRPRPCRARLPGKGGFFPGGILFFWLDLGLLDLHVGPSKLLISCTLTWVGASILLPCLCTVWATDPRFVASTMCGVIVVDVGRSRSTCLGRDAYIHDHCLEYRHNYALFYQLTNSNLFTHRMLCVQEGSL